MHINPIRTALCGLSILVLSGCATPQPGTNTVPETPELPLMLRQDAELVVFGLSCPLCASNLESQLRTIPGVAGHQIDLASGIVTINVRQGGFVPTSALRNAVTDAGFTLQDIRLKETP